MSREESLVAVLNAARALKAIQPVPIAYREEGAWTPIPWHALIALYSAIDAVDAVGEASTPPGMYQLGPGRWVSERVVARIEAEIAALEAAPEVLPGLCQADPECWRYADVGRTCYHHSPAARLPSLRRRDAIWTDAQEAYGE